jgi:NAD(P)-dependent dehydrogenase (short-subunit alcohol dehydrogenase family)
LRALTRQLNTNPQEPNVWTADVDVAEWESQLRAFKTAVQAFSGRIDYVFPIAGIGERRSFPNKPKADDFEKPDISVIEIDEIGVIYTVSLAVQHFRQIGKNKDGFKGRSRYQRYLFQ